jgi:TPR repeat protein
MLMLKYRCVECLEKGEGTTQNCEEAFKYFKMAADQGNAEAQAECEKRSKLK